MFGFYINRPIAIASYIASIDSLLLSLSEKSLHKANDVTAVKKPYRFKVGGKSK